MMDDFDKRARALDVDMPNCNCDKKYTCPEHALIAATLRSIECDTVERVCRAVCWLCAGERDEYGPAEFYSVAAAAEEWQHPNVVRNKYYSYPCKAASIRAAFALPALKNKK